MKQEVLESDRVSMVKSPKRLARIAGVLYLLVGIFGGFAEGYVDPRMYAPGARRQRRRTSRRIPALSAWASLRICWTGRSLSFWP